MIISLKTTTKLQIRIFNQCKKKKKKFKKKKKKHKINFFNEKKNFFFKAEVSLKQIEIETKIITTEATIGENTTIHTTEETITPTTEQYMKTITYKNFKKTLILVTMITIADTKEQIEIIKETTNLIILI